MNHSILTADRNTHMKVIAVALVAAAVVVAAGLNFRGDSSEREVARAGKGLVVKATNAIRLTDGAASQVR